MGYALHQVVLSSDGAWFAEFDPFNQFFRGRRPRGNAGFDLEENKFHVESMRPGVTKEDVRLR
jgi:hypothetical protein